ncbi:MAG: competence/damage-inducible protein A [Bacteroidota bacterium]
MLAEIITIGDEILIGQVIDSNSAWIAQQLNAIGIKIYQITSVSDNRDHILKALEEAGKRVKLVIITGGLGPTKDDITKGVLCDFFETKLVFSEKTLEDIHVLLSARGIYDINENNRNQAMVPEKCRLLANREGTAPGMLFEKNEAVYISIPGVPFEMMSIMNNEILPLLREKYTGIAIVHRVVMTQGIFEAKLSQVLSEWETGLAEKGIKLAYLPQPGIIRLRLTIEGNDKKVLFDLLEKEIYKLQQIIPEYIYGYDEEMPWESVGKLLGNVAKTLSTAESCTGGTIAHLITSVPGCSAYYTGSVVAYSNEIKQNLLGVKEETLIKYGAVSKQVVKEMALGVRKLTGSDYAIAVSGIAGPDGGTQEKPVGTTWIAVISDSKIVAEKFQFGENRERNIRKASLAAMHMLIKLIGL